MGKLTKSVVRATHQLRTWVLRRWANFRARRPLTAFGRGIEIATWLGLGVLSLVVLAPLQKLLPLTPEWVANVQSLLLAVGTAMIGATAIASSFVLFAIQANFERLPHGMFRRLSSDRRLLASFGASFVVAVGLGSLSLTSDPASIGIAIVAGVWALLTSLRLLLYAYRRSLKLVSPLAQLEMLREDGAAEMARWNRWVRWMTPLLPVRDLKDTQEVPEFDEARLTIFHANPGWSSGISHAIRLSVTFAKRAGEQGDREIVAAALSTVTALNAGYIATKGRTFFCDNLFFENALATDPLINDTLEQLRQLCRSAIARQDEPQIEAILKTYLSLTRRYLSIQYAGRYGQPYHAIVASGYLERAVESVIPHGLADVLMEGQRLMKEAAEIYLSMGHSVCSVGLIQKIGAVGAVGATNPDARAVALEAMRQYADLTVRLLASDWHDLHYVIGELRGAVTGLAQQFLNVPAARLSSIHSTFLGPIYSPTTGLASQLGQVANFIAEADAADEHAARMAGNLHEWAEGLFDSQKGLLLYAVEKRSNFVFDMIHWITDISEILYVVAQAPACPDHARGELEKHALWLVDTLGWIKRDADTVKFVDKTHFVDTLVDFGARVHRHGAHELLRSTNNVLIAWGFEGSQREQGWETLANALVGMAVLSTLNREGASDRALVASIDNRLAAERVPSQQVRSGAADAIRRRRDHLHQAAFFHKAIPAGADSSRTVTLLNAIADRLSPPE